MGKKIKGKTQTTVGNNKALNTKIQLKKATLEKQRQKN